MPNITSLSKAIVRRRSDKKILSGLSHVRNFSSYYYYFKRIIIERMIKLLVRKNTSPYKMTKLRDVFCALCNDTRFMHGRTDYISHAAVHMDNPYFMCSICGTRKRNIKSILSHRRTSHNGAGETLRLNTVENIEELARLASQCFPQERDIIYVKGWRARALEKPYIDNGGLPPPSVRSRPDYADFIVPPDEEQEEDGANDEDDEDERYAGCSTMEKLLNGIPTSCASSDEQNPSLPGSPNNEALCAHIKIETPDEYVAKKSVLAAALAAPPSTNLTNYPLLRARLNETPMYTSSTTSPSSTAPRPTSVDVKALQAANGQLLAEVQRLTALVGQRDSAINKLRAELRRRDATSQVHAQTFFQQELIRKEAALCELQEDRGKILAMLGQDQLEKSKLVERITLLERALQTQQKKL